MLLLSAERKQEQGNENLILNPFEAQKITFFSS